MYVKFKCKLHFNFYTISSPLTFAYFIWIFKYWKYNKFTNTSKYIIFQSTLLNPLVNNISLKIYIKKKNSSIEFACPNLPFSYVYLIPSFTTPYNNFVKYTYLTYTCIANATYSTQYIWCFKGVFFSYSFTPKC